MAKRDAVARKPKDTKGTLLRMLRYMTHFKWVLFGVMLLCIISNILALLGPTLAGKAISAAAAGKGKVNFGEVYYYAKQMLVFYLVSSLLTISINIIMMYVSRHIAARMRKDVFDKLMKLPVGFFDTNQAGDIISRVSYDIDVVSTCLGTDVVAVLTSTVTVAGSFAMMVYISPWLALVTLFTIPAAVTYTTKMRKITQPKFSVK